MRIIATAGALACLAVVASIMAFGGRPAPTRTTAAMLTSGTDFGLSGTVANLTPGISSRLILTVTNPDSDAITLTRVTITVSAVPLHCPVASLTVDGTAFSGSPPAVTITGLAAVVPAGASATVSFAMRLARRIANRCQHARFPLSYSGEATTGEPGSATFIHLISFPNPSEAGLPVVFTATVRADRIEPSPPTGEVTFYLCTDPLGLPSGSPASACTKSVPLGPPVETRGEPASLEVTSLPPGSHSIFARFTPETPDFLPSASTTITQSVISIGPSRSRASVRGARTR